MDEQGMLRRIIELERRVAALEGTPYGQSTADPEVQRLVDSGNLIGAIKRYRELTGVGLREAKDAVEPLSRRI